MFSSLCTLNAYYLEDNAICARVLLGLSNEGYFLDDFCKNFPWCPLCIFLGNAAFGWLCKNCLNLAIRALLEPLFAPKSSPVFALEVHTSLGIMPFAPECFWAFQTKATVWAIFEKFSLVPPLHFFRKCGFWVSLLKLPYRGHSGTFGAIFCPKIVSSFFTLSAY